MMPPMGAERIQYTNPELQPQLKIFTYVRIEYLQVSGNDK